MNLWIPATFFIALHTPAWAEDQPSEPAKDTYTLAMDIYTSAQDSEVKPSLVVEAPVQAAPPMIEAPKLSREDNAALHLSILRDEVDNMTQVGFFGSLFSENEELQQALMQDIELFLAIYSDLPITSEAMLLKGQMLAKQNHPEAAVVAWLQTMYEFPKSDTSLKARRSILDTIKSDWDDEADVVEGIIKHVPSKDIASRLRSLINQLYPINDQDIVQALTLLQLDFLKRFSDDPHADEVQILLAHNMGAESAESGIFGFRKLLTLYPESSYRAEAMLAIADLQRLRLKAYQKAADNYKVLIAQYPEHKLAKLAYENLALTQAEHLKSYPEAIATNQKIVELYPEDKVSLKALQNIAKLQRSKTDEPEQAIATLRKLATMFHGFEAPEALHDAIKIAEKKLKNEKLAFEIRQQLVNDYPQSDEAPEALFDMAEYAEQSGDAAQAKALYTKLINQYPSEKSLVRKARERI